MKRNCILICWLGVMTFLVSTAIAQEHAKPERSSKITADAPALSVNSKPADDNTLPRKTDRTQEIRHSENSRQSEGAEGEQRFRQNCGRCHQPPHKFPPRVMAAAIRHMRVRAMLTDEDMRLILRYMTQ